LVRRKVLPLLSAFPFVIPSEAEGSAVLFLGRGGPIE
jgi:hypothetical protein